MIVEIYHHPARHVLLQSHFVGRKGPNDGWLEVGSETPGRPRNFNPVAAFANAFEKQQQQLRGFQLSLAMQLTP